MERMLHSDPKTGDMSQMMLLANSCPRGIAGRGRVGRGPHKFVAATWKIVL